jgi:hypothetical protein
VGIGVGVEELQMLAWSDGLSVGSVRCRSADRVKDSDHRRCGFPQVQVLCPSVKARDMDQKQGLSLGLSAESRCVQRLVER